MVHAICGVTVTLLFHLEKLVNFQDEVCFLLTLAYLFYSMCVYSINMSDDSLKYSHMSLTEFCSNIHIVQGCIISRDDIAILS